MFGSHKVKIEGELMEKVKRCAEASGFEAVDEFVLHLLENETKKLLAQDEDKTLREEVDKRLRGLGYLK
jgi:phage head maturation protease